MWWGNPGVGNWAKWFTSLSLSPSPSDSGRPTKVCTTAMTLTWGAATFRKQFERRQFHDEARGINRQSLLVSKHAAFLYHVGDGKRYDMSPQNQSWNFPEQFRILLSQKFMCLFICITICSNQQRLCHFSIITLNLMSNKLIGIPISNYVERMTEVSSIW